MTQKQLAERLLISDKTVSKWERGKGLPEVGLMLPLCELLEITVNDLLSGEKISENNYQKKAADTPLRTKQPAAAQHPTPGAIDPSHAGKPFSCSLTP